MKEYINDGLREQNKTAYDWLWLAQCIAVDYDGYRTQKGLMGLVDELAAYIGEARALLDKQRAEDIEEFAERVKREIVETYDDGRFTTYHVDALVSEMKEQVKTENPTYEARNVKENDQNGGSNSENRGFEFKIDNGALVFLRDGKEAYKIDEHGLWDKTGEKDILMKW